MTWMPAAPPTNTGFPEPGIGILVSCVRRGFLSYDEAEALLGEMIAFGYRSPVDSLRALID